MKTLTTELYDLARKQQELLIGYYQFNQHLLGDYTNMLAEWQKPVMQEMQKMATVFTDKVRG